MSLLSNTQGRPERVHSLLKLLKACGGKLGQEQIVAWLQPPSRRGEKGSTSAAEQTMGNARSLGFVAEAPDGPKVLELKLDPVPEDPADFADAVYERLRTRHADLDDPDRVVLEVYALFVVQTEREQGSSWIEEYRNVESLADFLDDALPKPADAPKVKRFNKDKYSSAWRSLMIYLGLGWEGPGLPSFLPHPAVRLARELKALGAELGHDKELPAGEFLDALARRMPYLDGGALFQQAALWLQWLSSAPRLSLVLSAVLRELHDDGLLRLESRADAAGAILLAADPTHPVRAFSIVRIAGGSP